MHIFRFAILAAVVSSAFLACGGSQVPDVPAPTDSSGPVVPPAAATDTPSPDAATAPAMPASSVTAPAK